MSTLFVDTINEKTSGNGMAIPGHVVHLPAKEGVTALIKALQGRCTQTRTSGQYHAEVQQQFNLNNCFSKRLNCRCKFI